MEFKFLPADEEDVTDIYMRVRTVMLTFEVGRADAFTLEPEFVKQYKKIRSNYAEYKVLKYDGVKAGYYYFHAYKDGMMIEDIYIEQKFRYQGACSSILRRCISETEKPIYAEVYGTNVAALSILRKYGFVVDEWLNHYKVMMKYDNKTPFRYPMQSTEQNLSDWMRESYIQEKKLKERKARRKAKEQKENSTQ